jgi:hypothetical protein
LLVALLGVLAASAAHAEERHIAVVVILATKDKNEVDPRVKCIAEEVQKLEPALTGFRLTRSTCKAVTIGARDSFPLVEDEVLEVLLHQVEVKEGKEGKENQPQEKARLTIKPPLAGEITYSCCNGKFFPVLTRYITRDNERLIVAIMVKPVKKP